MCRCARTTFRRSNAPRPGDLFFDRMTNRDLVLSVAFADRSNYPRTHRMHGECRCRTDTEPLVRPARPNRLDFFAYLNPGWLCAPPVKESLTAPPADAMQAPRGVRVHHRQSAITGDVVVLTWCCRSRRADQRRATATPSNADRAIGAAALAAPR